jgi:hypothetical protein
MFPFHQNTNSFTVVCNKIDREYVACTTKFLELTGGEKMIYPEELENMEEMEDD